MGQAKVAQMVGDIAFVSTVIGLGIAVEMGTCATGTAATAIAILEPFWLPISIVGGIAGLFYIGLKGTQWIERQRLRKTKQPMETFLKHWISIIK